MDTVTTSTQYDALDRPWLVVGPSTDGTATQDIYDYDAVGNQTVVREALTPTGRRPRRLRAGLLNAYTWRVTTSSYDALGRVYQTQVTTPDVADANDASSTMTPTATCDSASTLWAASRPIRTTAIID